MANSIIHQMNFEKVHRSDEFASRLVGHIPSTPLAPDYRHYQAWEDPFEGSRELQRGSSNCAKISKAAAPDCLSELGGRMEKERLLKGRKLILLEREIPVNSSGKWGSPGRGIDNTIFIKSEK